MTFPPRAGGGWKLLSGGPVLGDKPGVGIKRHREVRTRRGRWIKPDPRFPGSRAAWGQEAMCRKEAAASELPGELGGQGKAPEGQEDRRERISFIALD